MSSLETVVQPSRLLYELVEGCLACGRCLLEVFSRLSLMPTTPRIRGELYLSS